MNPTGSEESSVRHPHSPSFPPRPHSLGDDASLWGHRENVWDSTFVAVWIHWTHLWRQVFWKLPMEDCISHPWAIDRASAQDHQDQDPPEDQDQGPAGDQTSPSFFYQGGDFPRGHPALAGHAVLPPWCPPPLNGQIIARPFGS